MRGLLDEIIEIPKWARECLRVHASLKLPVGVPYVGMGSSYNAPLVLYYSGAPIEPQMASEYFYYRKSEKLPLGVLISQSGSSSETLWCTERFERFLAVTATPASALAHASNCSGVIDIHTDREEFFSATKSFTNTLITLSIGLGIDMRQAVGVLASQFSALEEAAKRQTDRVSNYLNNRHTKGLYILGSGPNYGIALQGALTLSEVTKYAWVGMSVAQFDHGPKETADDSIIITLNARGYNAKRLASVLSLVEKKSNACIVRFSQDSLPEIQTPLPFICQLNFFMNYLADNIGVGSTFALGKKVTKVDDTLR